MARPDRDMGCLAACRTVLSYMQYGVITVHCAINGFFCPRLAFACCCCKVLVIQCVMSRSAKCGSGQRGHRESNCLPSNSKVNMKLNVNTRSKYYYAAWQKQHSCVASASVESWGQGGVSRAKRDEEAEQPLSINWYATWVVLQ